MEFYSLEQANAYIKYLEGNYNRLVTEYKIVAGQYRLTHNSLTRAKYRDQVNRKENIEFRELLKSMGGVKGYLKMKNRLAKTQLRLCEAKQRIRVMERSTFTYINHIVKQHLLKQS